jgi:hypothetical protein
MAHAPALDDRRSAARHGVILLGELPPVGVICFQQPSGLPSYDGVGPASVKTQDGDPDAMLGDLDVVDDMGPQRWTLRSQSLEILPTGTWRVMATLTARGTAGLVEPRFEVDPKSSRDVLVLRGPGGVVLDRRAFGIGKRAWIFGPRIQLELAGYATRLKPALGPQGHTSRGGPHA